MMRSWNEGWLCGPGSYFHGPWDMGKLPRQGDRSKLES